MKFTSFSGENTAKSIKERKFRQNNSERHTLLLFNAVSIRNTRV